MTRLATYVALALSALLADASVYNVRDFGATGNGTALDSPAINKAIEEAVKAGGEKSISPPETI